MFDHKKYYIENREKFKKYREDNRENQKEYIKEYKENNPEKIKINEKKYNKTEKGKINKQKKDSKRRSLFKLMINTLTVKEWKSILKKHKNRCAYCGVEFTKDIPPTKDHIVPLSKGGHNIKENIVPACRSCNCKKWAKITKPFQLALNI